MLIRSLAALLSAALAAACQPAEACDPAAAAHCEGMVLVACAPGNAARGPLVTREDCAAETNLCLARADGAACVARDAPCDPASTAKACPDLRFAEVCEPVFAVAPTSYPRIVDSVCTEATLPFCFDARKACGKLN